VEETPSVLVGGLVGPSKTGSQPGPGNAVPGAASEPEPLPLAVQAHLTGIPDTLPPTWCPNCKAEVLPKGKGLCPRCSRVLKGSFLARKHPVNQLRRQQLLSKLCAEYQPQTTLLHASCEHLAGCLEQLEALKPGGAEHARLLEQSQKLGAALEASRSSSPRTTDDDYAEMTEDELIHRLETMLEAVRASRDVKRLGTGIVDAVVVDDGATVLEPGDPGHAEQEATLATAAHEPKAPEPTCRYGCGSLERCAEIKATRPDTWAALHSTDPEEVARRDKDATALMMHMIGKTSPYL
jgi:hypothetical protein